jgi:phosphopantetheine adenylyltransferase
MSKAIIQTVNYLDAIKQKNFKNSSDREKITETTHEENLYRPRGIIIISSDEKLSKNNKDLKNVINRDFTKLRNSLHSIEILTFDEILNIADNYCKNIVKK